jgi:hypothetical protein
MMSGGHELGFGFHRTRPGHGDEFVPANLQIEYWYSGLEAIGALQNIGRFRKSFVPTHPHDTAPIRGKIRLLVSPNFRLHPKIEVREWLATAPAFSFVLARLGVVCDG